MDTWIVGKVRAVSLRHLVAWGLSIGVGVLVLLGSGRYIDNFVRGPFQFGPADLDAIIDPAESPHYFAKVAGSKVIDTGIREYSVHSSAGVARDSSPAGAYYALVIGDKFLIVKRDHEGGAVAEGELKAWPPELAEHLFDTDEMQKLRPRFYPFYVSNDSFRIQGYVLMGLVLLFGYLFVRYAIPSWRHFRDPSAHPLVTRVAGWGDPIAVAVEAEREFGEPRFKGKNGWRVGDKYLVQRNLFRFDVLRLQDLLWGYKKTTRHSVNFIPTGKTYQAILICYGGTADVQGKENRVDEILMFAHQRVPWAIFGFTPEIEKTFRTQQAEFIGAVQARRAQAEQKG